LPRWNAGAEAGLGLLSAIQALFRPSRPSTFTELIAPVHGVDASSFSPSPLPLQLLPQYAYAERFPGHAVLANGMASSWLTAFLKHTDKQALQEVDIELS
jgi:hypothetical protein